MIEPLDPGKVAAIHVEAGQSVKAGDLLFELDPAEATADAQSAEAARTPSLAEIARRRYAIEAVRGRGSRGERGGGAGAESGAHGSTDGRSTGASPIERLAAQPG